MFNTPRSLLQWAHGLRPLSDAPQDERLRLEYFLLFLAAAVIVAGIVVGVTVRAW